MGVAHVLQLATEDLCDDRADGVAEELRVRDVDGNGVLVKASPYHHGAAIEPTGGTPGA